MKRLFKLLAAALFLSATACQQDIGTRGPAYQAAEKYTIAISKSFSGSRGVTSNARGLTSTNDPFSYFSQAYGTATPTQWSQWGNGWGTAAQTGTYGSYLMYPSMADEAQRCIQMLNSIPERMENLDMLMGTEERCLARLFFNQSGIMNYAWRQEDPRILSYAGYAINYPQPAAFGQNSYAGYNQFLLNGSNSWVVPSQSSGYGW